MSSTRSSTPALVVGGGPVGLTLASELYRHGVPCRLVDALPAPQVWSKAAGISARTMEVFQDMGVVDRILERGRPMYGLNFYDGARRVAHVSIDVPHTPYPYIFGLEQRQTELVLAEHLTALGGTLEREVALVGLAHDASGVTATLRHADGREEVVETPWLLACDGAHSFVRRALEVPFEGSTFEQLLWQADIRMRFPFDLDPNEAVAFLAEDGPYGALPLLDEGRYRLIVIAPPWPDEEPTLERFQELTRMRAPEGVEVSDPAWMVRFRFHGRIVPSYRPAPRIFLAGDAAHIHSPAGAQGMNMGIQDAYNLAWKLALVINGLGRPEILDSYHPERHPVGQSVVQATDRATQGAMRMMTLRSPLARGLRNQAVSFVMNTGFLPARLFQGLSGVTVDYAASPIVGEHHSSIWTAEIGTPRDERPRVSDWMHFSRGPGPGARVPDTDLPAGCGAPTLFELLRGTSHTLLLFDGDAATDAGYQNLDRIAARIERRYGARVRVHIAVPHAERPAALAWQGSVLHDVDSALHAHFGCGTEGLYLVRPDGYVGFRSQPAEEVALLRYLERIFVD